MLIVELKVRAYIKDGFDIRHGLQEMLLAEDWVSCCDVETVSVEETDKERPGYDEEDERFVFYWTEDDDTSKGVKVYVYSEEDRQKVLAHYFEASIGPLDGIDYNDEPIRYSGVIGSVDGRVRL